VDELLPAVEPSVSQYRVPAHAAMPKSHGIRIAQVITAMVRKALLEQHRAWWPVRFFNLRPMEGMFATLSQIALAINNQ